MCTLFTKLPKSYNLLPLASNHTDGNAEHTYIQINLYSAKIV